MTKFLFGITIILVSLTINPSAMAETVEMSVGGTCDYISGIPIKENSSAVKNTVAVCILLLMVR